VSKNEQNHKTRTAAQFAEKHFRQ